MDFYKLIEIQYNIKIKAFRLDNTREFKSNKQINFTRDKDIINKYTSPYTPAQNSISKISIKYIKEKLVSIYLEMSIPFKLQPYIIQAITHIKNRTYNRTINITPYKTLNKAKPFIEYIKIISSIVYTLIPKEVRKEAFNKKYKKGILIGFESSNNYLIYIQKENKVINSRDCLIKKGLVYNNKYKLNKEEYSNFIKDFKNSKNIISSNNNNNSINNPIKKDNNPIELPLNNNNEVIELKDKSNNKESINNSSDSEIKEETIEVQYPLDNIIINNNNNNNSFILESKLTIG